MKSTLQKLTAFLSCAFICNSLHATGMEDDSSSMALIIIIFAASAIAFIIFSHVNEKKRKRMIAEEEQGSKDFDISNSIGNLNVKMYFDLTKDKVLIKRFTSKSVVTEYIDSLSFRDNSLIGYKHPYFCAYDASRGNALVGHFENKDVKYGIVHVFNNYGTTGKGNKSNIHPSLEYVCFQKQLNSEIMPQPFWLIVDEAYNQIAIININSSLEKIQYDNCNPDDASKNNIPSIKKLCLGKYVLLQNDSLQKLMIIDNGKFVTINYSDIIEVSYEENGETLFSSLSPSIGGAIVGGALFGTAGAIVGGLGNKTTKQSRMVKNMDVKILLRNHRQASYTLNFKDTKGNLNTSIMAMTYNRYLTNANQAKDLITVIIDKIKQQEQQNNKLAVQAAMNNKP